MAKKLLFRYAVLLFVIIETFSILNGYILIRGWIPMIIMLGLSIIFYPDTFNNKPTFFLLLYAFLLIIFSLRGRTFNAYDTILFIFNEIMYPMICFSIINILVYNRDLKGLKIISLLILIIVIIASIPTIVLSYIDPDLVRTIVSSISVNDTSNTREYQRLGIASFGMIHALPFIFPLLVYRIKFENNIYYRLIFISLIIVPYYMLLKASFATPLILSTLGIIFAILISQNQKKNKVLTISLIILLFFISNKQMLIDGLSFIKPVFSSTVIDNKINDIIDSIMFGEMRGGVSGRSDLYNISWNTFLNNPLFGSANVAYAGGHSFLLDRLAYMGLFGSIPLLMFFILAFKKQYLRIGNEKKKYYLLSVLLFIMMAIMKNLGGPEIFLFLFVLIPGLCYFELDTFSPKINKPIFNFSKY